MRPTPTCPTCTLLSRPLQGPSAGGGWIESKNLTLLRDREGTKVNGVEGGAVQNGRTWAASTRANTGIADVLRAPTRAMCVSRAKVGRGCSQLLQLTAITSLISMPAHACAIQARADWASCARSNSRRNILVKNERAQARTIQSRSYF